MMRRWRGAGSSRSAEGFAVWTLAPGMLQERDFDYRTGNPILRAVNGRDSVVPVQNFEAIRQNLPTADGPELKDSDRDSGT